jgi:predicted transcriptional regulator
MTQRALAVYLDLSETMIEKTLKTLIEQGLITKTKLNRKNVYTFDTNLLLKNADIQRIPAVLKRIHDMSRSSHEVADEAPF